MNQTTKWIIIGVAAASLLGLCLVVGGVGLIVVLASRHEAAVWESVVTEKDRCRKEIRGELAELHAKYTGEIPLQERTTLIRRAAEADQRVGVMLMKDERLRSKTHAETEKKLGQPLMAEVMLAFNGSRRPAPRLELANGDVGLQMFAQRAEADVLRDEIDKYYEVAGEPGTKRKLTQDQESIIFKMREIEQSMRAAVYTDERLATVRDAFVKLQDEMVVAVREASGLASRTIEPNRQAPNNTKIEDVRPQPPENYSVAPSTTVTPPVAKSSKGKSETEILLEQLVLGNLPGDISSLQPEEPEAPAESTAPVDPFNPTEIAPFPDQPMGVEPVAVPPMTTAGESLPGFSVEDIGQLRMGVKVLVKAQGKWYPAIIQAKRNKLFEVRYGAGDVAVVTTDRIRLQDEPAPAQPVPK